MVIPVTMEQYARRYDRHDLDRLGLFIEMPYMCTDQKKPKKKKPEVRPVILPNMIPDGPKTKCGNQDGYFDEHFKRVFIGEFRKRVKRKKKIEAPKVPFLPTNPTKIQASPGDYFGCFVDEWPASVDPRVRGKKKSLKDLKKRPVLRPNPITNPGRKGGPGFVDITINPYPEHSDEPPPKPKKKGHIKPGPLPFYRGSRLPYFTPNPYVDPEHDPPKKPIYIAPKPPKKTKKNRAAGPTFLPSGPGKWPGGNHDGCFDKWPEHHKEPYLTPAQIQKFVKIKKRKKHEPPPTWLRKDPFKSPNLMMKTLQTTSVLYSTEFSINADNWKSYTVKYIKNL